MSLRARAMRWLRSTPLDDIPVRLHCSAPTVTPEAAAALKARPVRTKTGSGGVFFGSRATQAIATPPQATPRIASESVREITETMDQKSYRSA